MRWFLASQKILNRLLVTAMNSTQDAFISYGRADSKAFAAKLNDHLLAEDLNIWFDFDDIPLGVDYQNQIDDGIEKANNFLFIISPHSVNSVYQSVPSSIARGRSLEQFYGICADDPIIIDDRGIW